MADSDSRPHLSTSRKGMRTTPSQSARLPSRSTLNSPGKKSRMGDTGSVISSWTCSLILGFSRSASLCMLVVGILRLAASLSRVQKALRLLAGHVYMR